MLSFIRSGRARKAMAAALAATFVLSVAGCGQKQQQGGNLVVLVFSFVFLVCFVFW